MEHRFRLPIDIEEHEYDEGNEPEFAAIGNVAVTTTNERLFLRQPIAALSLRHSQTALGAYYRQIARRLGADVAVFATARTLAVLIYRMLRWGRAYIDEGTEAYENRYKQRRIGRLITMAKDLGYQITPPATEA